MGLLRLDLPDGQWADLLVKPRHVEYVAILEAAEDDSGVLWLLTLGQEYTKAWQVRKDDGGWADVKDWSQIDPDITDAICQEARNRWQEWDEARVPLVTPRQRKSLKTTGTSAAPSDATPEASPST